MELSLREMEIIERLLKNRLSADYDPEIDMLSQKITGEISKILYPKQRSDENAKKIKERYSI